MKTWTWAVQYGIAILLAIVLGAILGSISLFEETILGATGLAASDVVKFLGYGSALLLLWLFGRQATTRLPENVKVFSFCRHIIVPMVTLIVVVAAYKVVLLITDAFCGNTAITIYNWVFVLGIIGSALWLAIECYRNSSLLIEAFAGLKGAGQPTVSKTSSTCPQCGTTVSVGMKFCSHCGHSLAGVVCQNCGQPLSAGQKFCAACGKAT